MATTGLDQFRKSFHNPSIRSPSSQRIHRPHKGDIKTAGARRSLLNNQHWLTRHVPADPPGGGRSVLQVIQIPTSHKGAPPPRHRLCPKKSIHGAKRNARINCKRSGSILLTGPDIAQSSETNEQLSSKGHSNHVGQVHKSSLRPAQISRF